MCVGRIDPAIILETFAKGADGILVVGCYPPDCHYVEGNLQAERKIRMLKKLISRTGLEPERLRLEWAYASEIERFAKIIDDFRNHVIALGQSPLAREKPDANILLNVKAAKAATEGFRLRLLVGREIELTERGNMYGEKISQEEFDKAMDDAIDAEYLRNKIRLLVKNVPLSVRELSEHLDADPREVLHHIMVMRQEGLITVGEVKGTTPLYIAMEEAIR
jgi:coenzyme F420-reducing hydrogenase delta subunit